MLTVIKVFFFSFFLLPLLNAADLDPSVFVENAKIKHFKLPVFSNNGYKKFDFYGEEGVLQNSNMKISNMKLSIFDTSAPDSLEILMISSLANLNVKTHCVQSDSPLTVQGRQFDLTGRSWSWNSQDNTLLVKDHVKIIFKLDLSSLLE